jgi:hypothetical protein
VGLRKDLCNFEYLSMLQFLLWLLKYSSLTHKCTRFSSFILLSDRGIWFQKDVLRSIFRRKVEEVTGGSERPGPFSHTSPEFA